MRNPCAYLVLEYAWADCAILTNVIARMRVFVGLLKRAPMRQSDGHNLEQQLCRYNCHSLDCRLMLGARTLIFRLARPNAICPKAISNIYCKILFVSAIIGIQVRAACTTSQSANWKIMLFRYLLSSFLSPWNRATFRMVVREAKT